ncbi:response regulator [uncultured Winogradskyella sp.]|uniref:response regulator n=1 Tax=Winogradskyella sp. 4-2091 TaxID=3381659 RepID=UPI0026339F25|nr:response regulator [uncultured Winogradskyella sp.]
MHKTYNVLIIDDHPFVIDGFERALHFIANQSGTMSFRTHSSTCCKTAYDKLQNYTTSQDLDLVILDISLPMDKSLKISCGKDLGILIRKWLPNTKILVCTMHVNSYKLRQILNAFDPLGFINKADVNFQGFVAAINDVLNNKLHYSQTIINAIKQKSSNQINLDDYDILILKELANGAKMNDLLKLIHLSKSGIDKRKRLLKVKFGMDTNSDRDLVLAARAKGFI